VFGNPSINHPNCHSTTAGVLPLKKFCKNDFQWLARAGLISPFVKGEGIGKAID